MSKLFTVLLLGLLGVAVAAKHSLPLQRHAHRVLSAAEAKTRMSASLRSAPPKHRNLFAEPTHYRYHGSAPNSPGTSSVFVNGSIVDLGFYFTTLDVGSAESAFALDIDTGSSTLTVPAAGCQGCGSVPEYNPAASKDADDLMCNSAACNCGSSGQGHCCSTVNSSLCGFHIQYGEGFVSGNLVKDQVCFQGHCGTGTLAAIEISKDFGPKTTGILGFGYPALDCTPTCLTPLFGELVQQGVYKDIFSLCLTEQGGMLDLGFADPKKMAGAPVYVPITLEAWYIIPMKDTLVGNSSIGVPASFYNHSQAEQRIGSFVDSGATLVVQNPTIFNATRHVFETDPRYKDLPGIKGSPNIFDPTFCTPSIDGYPTITFVLDGQAGQPDVHLQLEPKYYMLPFQQSGQTCYSFGIQANNEIGVVLGDVFIQSHYVIFDRANTRLGFAPLATCV